MSEVLICGVHANRSCALAFIGDLVFLVPYRPACSIGAVVASTLAGVIYALVKMWLYRLSEAPSYPKHAKPTRDQMIKLVALHNDHKKLTEERARYPTGNPASELSAERT